ncbi:hypothetical protein T440DRAFT_502098 [Plenodomus tracheiphilus IPT5]|uniref:Uncharacterized protein n=1 Tax=Plenodomus tracheiphilus IPT5 TaxID=1408161 RepID=A0A6A7ARI6_9PLEO|nr:hypothetical protein T440DRAFT_502098 [Plenodomus tracheiphilus IPT5]
MWKNAVIVRRNYPLTAFLPLHLLNCTRNTAKLARLNESPVQMDPPASPVKPPFSRDMPVFPVSPVRLGTPPRSPRYGGESPAMSPSQSAPNLRSPSPLHASVESVKRRHQRTNSEISVSGLAVMFENLEVKDPKEAAKRYKEALAKEKAKGDKAETRYQMLIDRKDIYIEQLKSDLEKAKASLEVGISKSNYEREYMSSREKIASLSQRLGEMDDRYRSISIKLERTEHHRQMYEEKYIKYKKQTHDLTKENLRVSGRIPALQADAQALQRKLQRAESDVRFKTEEATKYQNQVYSLQVEVESVTVRSDEQIQSLQEKLKVVEEERDALKTSLKEEEVMRVAAEGSIALPIAAADENDEFESPRNEDDKENVSPKKGAVELRFLQQELASERQLRERAQEQIDFMKMEHGRRYMHDNTYAAEMERIKINHEDNQVEDAVVKHEPVESERPFTPPSEETLRSTQDVHQDNTILMHTPPVAPDTILAYSPSTGTFRSVPSPVKAAPTACVVATLQPSPLIESKHSDKATDAGKPIIMARPQSRVEFAHGDHKDNKTVDISIHEDAIEDSEDEDTSPPTPPQEPTGPATPYLTRTITTTTTIPLHFSPATPAFKPGRGPMTPSTIAHAAADARTPILGELSLNKLPFDREAALEAIRERRGRARSMAAGHGTPMKQMVDGGKDRRDISAPVSRVRR